MALHFILFICFAFRAADGRIVPTAKGRCNIFLRNIARAVPVPEDRDRDGAKTWEKRSRRCWGSFKSTKTDKEAVNFWKSQGIGESPLTEMGDGHDLHYHVGGDDTENKQISPNNFAGSEKD